MIRFIIFFSFSLISTQLIGQQLTWVQKANYGGGQIYAPFSFVINGKGYVGTGVQPGGMRRSDFWEYNPQTNIWTQKANFVGAARYGAVGFGIGNFGYAGTGWSPNNSTDFYRYDPSLNVWTPVTSFGGSGRYTSCSFELNGQGYVGLGYSGCKNDFWRYNPTSNSWTQTAVFPGAARQAGVSFVANGFAYVGTGLCPGTLYSDFYRYNPVTNNWMPVATFPGPPRNAAFAFSLGTKGYVAMGFDYNGVGSGYSIHNDFWEYDPATDSWNQLPNFPGPPRFEGFNFVIGNYAYIGVGCHVGGFSNYINDVWEYGDHTSSIVEINNQSVSIHPNPASTQITITLEEPQWNNRFVTLDILSAEGKLVAREKVKITGGKYVLDVTKLSAGNYVISLTDGKSSSRGRFIKAGM
jgi:N-acetylneuraminic acid mutarotase